VTLAGLAVVVTITIATAGPVVNVIVRITGACTWVGVRRIVFTAVFFIVLRVIFSVAVVVCRGFVIVDVVVILANLATLVVLVGVAFSTRTVRALNLLGAFGCIHQLPLAASATLPLLLWLLLATISVSITRVGITIVVDIGIVACLVCPVAVSSALLPGLALPLLGG
jgi:hypothetical protein